jgi:hypothetical protein
LQNSSEDFLKIMLRSPNFNTWMPPLDVFYPSTCTATTSGTLFTEK